MWTILHFRLKLMYRSRSVGLLAVAVILVTSLLLAGLYSGAETSSKLKIGVVFEATSPLTEEIFKELTRSEIILPKEYSLDEGMTAVEESRVEALFVFAKDFETSLTNLEFEKMVDVYFLDENYLPYIMTDIVGSELIGEIAVTTVLTYFEGAMEEAGFSERLDDVYLGQLHDQGKDNLHEEVDNFHVKKTYINEDNITVNDIVLDNELIFRQIVFGVVYVFVAFYSMFLAVTMVRDRESGMAARWQMTGIVCWKVALGEWMSIYVGGMPILLAITMVEGLFDNQWLYYLLINGLFGLAYASLMYMVGSIFNKVTVFVLVTTALVMVLGVISGSFFVLDTDNLWLRGLTLMAPSYHLSRELTEKAIVFRRWPAGIFSLYMIVFASVTFVLGMISNWLQKTILQRT